MLKEKEKDGYIQRCGVTGARRPERISAIVGVGLDT